MKIPIPNTAPLLYLIFISGCSFLTHHELAEVCGHPVSSSGQKCCAIGTLEVGTNEFQPKSYTCTASQAACKTNADSESYKWPYVPDGSYKDNSEFNSGCARTSWKRVSDLSLSKPQLIKKVTAATTSDIDCQAQCNYDFDGKATGDVRNCPEIELNPSVPARLFSFFAKTDPTKNSAETEIIDIATIASQAEIAKCLRSDVIVHKNGLIQNIGAACVSEVDFSAGDGSHQEASLGINELLSGTSSEGVKTNQRWMNFTEKQTSFSLVPSDRTLQADYKGYVSKSGMIYDVVVAELVNDSGNKVCVRGKSNLAASKSDAALFKDIDKEKIKLMMGNLIRNIGTPLQLPDQSSQTMHPYFNSLQSFTDVDEKERSKFAKEILSSEAPAQGTSIDYVASIAAWLDAGLCHKALYRGGSLQHEYLAAIEKSLLAEENPTKKKSNTKRLLRCIAYPYKVSESFNSALEEMIQN